MKKAILVSFLVASTLFFALPTAQSHEGLSGIAIFFELHAGSGGQNAFYSNGFDFDTLFLKKNPPDPVFLECKGGIDKAKYVLRFESPKTLARDKENNFFYWIDQLSNGKHWKRSGKLSVAGVQSGHESKLLSLNEGDPKFNFEVWATTDASSIEKNHKWSSLEFACRNR